MEALKKRGRPKKNVAIAEATIELKKRGRPSKNKSEENQNLLKIISDKNRIEPIKETFSTRSYKCVCGREIVFEGEVPNKYACSKCGAYVNFKKNEEN